MKNKLSILCIFFSMLTCVVWSQDGSKMVGKWNNGDDVLEISKDDDMYKVSAKLSSTSFVVRAPYKDGVIKTNLLAWGDVSYSKKEDKIYFAGTSFNRTSDKGVEIRISKKRTLKDIYESISVSNNGALFSILPHGNTVKLYKSSNLLGKPILVIQPNTNNTLFVLDILKDTKCDYKFRIIEKNGNLGWASNCDDIYYEKRSFTNGVKMLRSDGYGENFWSISEIKKSLDLKKNFLSKNNSLVKKSDRRKFSDRRILFDCDISVNEINLVNNELISNNKEIDKFIIKEKNVFQIEIDKIGNIFIEGISKEIKDLQWELISFLDNGGGIGVPSKDGKPGNPCPYCKGQRSEFSSDHPNKAFISILNTDASDRKFTNLYNVHNAIRNAYVYLWERKEMEETGSNKIKCSEELNKFRIRYYPVNIIYQNGVSIEKGSRLMILKDKAEVAESIISDHENNEIIEEEIIEDVPFTIIEEVPVFPGCSGNKQELKACFNQQMQRHFIEKFNSNLPNQLGLLPGKKRIIMLFKIDRRGNIVDIRAKAPHPRLQKEAARVIKLLPKMTSGKQRGKTVGVKYTFSMRIDVEPVKKD